MPSSHLSIGSSDGVSGYEFRRSRPKKLIPALDRWAIEAPWEFGGPRGINRIFAAVPSSNLATGSSEDGVMFFCRGLVFWTVSCLFCRGPVVPNFYLNCCRCLGVPNFYLKCRRRLVVPNLYFRFVGVWLCPPYIRQFVGV